MFGSSGYELFFKEAFLWCTSPYVFSSVSLCKIYFPVIDLNVNCNQEID